MNLLDESSSLRPLSEAQQILGELLARRQIIRLKSERASLRGGAFGETVFLRQFVADEIIHLRIGLPKFQRLVAELFFRAGVVPQIRQHRAIGQRLRLMGIHRQHDGELSSPPRHIVRRQSRWSASSSRLGMCLGIDRERRVECLQHLLAVAGFKRPRQAGTPCRDRREIFSSPRGKRRRPV